MRYLRSAGVQTGVLASIIVVCSVLAACQESSPEAMTPAPTPVLGGDLSEGNISVWEDDHHDVVCYIWDGNDSAGGISCVANHE